MSKLHTVVTHLEMTREPEGLDAPLPAGAFMLRAERPDISFYRWLHVAVGEPWLWWFRRTLPDSAVEAIIHDPRVEVWVLYADGQPAGFVELDGREDGEIEIVYCGLMPRFLGRGLGGPMLANALRRAWSLKPRRVWLHTCTLDDPRAIGFYRRHGFRPFKEEVEIIDDPRVTGILPRNAGRLCPNLPSAGGAEMVAE